MMDMTKFLLRSDETEASREMAVARTAAVSGDAVPAEHIAAIAAALAAMYTDIPEEHIAVIAAAIAAYDEETGASMPLVNIRRGLNVWAMTGRQEAMAARKF